MTLKRPSSSSTVSQHEPEEILQYKRARPGPGYYTKLNQGNQSFIDDDNLHDQSILRDDNLHDQSILHDDNLHDQSFNLHEESFNLHDY